MSETTTDKNSAAVGGSQLERRVMRPQCKTNGSLGPGVLCGAVLVGGRRCSRPLGECENQACPQCGSWEGLKFPRGHDAYCEDCGWPDEDFGA